jgi:hypothetical protein
MLSTSSLRLPAAALGLAVAACGPSHRLGEYNFRQASVAAVCEVPPYPDVLTGPLVIDLPDNPVGAVLEAGSRAAREVSARLVEEKLDSATARVDLALLIEDESLRRASRALGAEAGPDTESDFLLEIWVHEYGIQATDWDATANFFIDADATLLDSHDGREVWRAGVRAQDPVGPEVFGPGAVRDVVTAAAIANLSAEEMARALEQLAEFTAYQITEQLRYDLVETRRSR